MDVGKSFTYMFEDKDWIAKIAIGGLLVMFSFLLIPLPLLLGYALRVTRNVADGNPTPLPEWNDFGQMFMQGLSAIVGAIIWFVPVLVLTICWMLSSAGIAAVGGNSDAGASLVSLVSFCMLCLTTVVSVALSFFIYAPITRFAINGQINSFWDFQGTWKFIQANIGDYVIVFLLVLVAGFIAGFGVILCFIGVFFTTFWGYLVGAHLFGQVARSHMTPTDSSMMPPPMDEPPGMMQGPMEPAPSA